jgi:hypothetical protein
MLKNIVYIIVAILAIGYLMQDKEKTQTSIADNAKPQTTAAAEKPAPAPSLVEVNRPEVQSNFLALTREAQSKGKTAENDMQKGGLLATRNSEVCKLLATGGSVENWTGKISKIDSNSDGKGVFGVEIGKDIQRMTWNNALSDIGDETLLEPGSDLFNRISAMKVGTEIKFSGAFIADSSMCLKESSITLNGKLLKPEFIFKFSDVTPL